MSGTQVVAGLPPPITPAMLLAGTDAVARPITAVTLAGAISQATGGPTLIFVQQASDFGTPVANVVTLLDETTYVVVSDIDLAGARLVGGSNTAIIGISSEVSIIRSTGLASALVTSTAPTSIILRDITITADIGISINGQGTMACDWQGVNFTNCPVVGTIQDVTNFVYSRGAFLSAANLTFSGSIGTVSFSECLFSGRSGEVSIILPAGLTVTRRFRAIYSSFVCPATSTGISVDNGCTIPDEAYILDTVNFSGLGTKVSGVGATDNRALWIRCVGIDNTSVNGQMYMQENAVSTAIANTVDFYKIAGTTTASGDNARYTMPLNNRLLNGAAIQRKFLIVCSLSFTTTANNVCRFGFYDSKIAAVRTPSRTLATANAAGRAESVSLQCVVSHGNGNYLEVHVQNTTATNAIVVTDLNITVTELGS